MWRWLIPLWLAAPVCGALHTVSGCVKDEQGAPSPGAAVRIVELEGPLELALTADRRGCYRQELVPDGAYEVRAASPGGALARAQIVLDQRKFNVTVNLQYRPVPMPAPGGASAVPPMINLRMLAAGAAEKVIQSITFNRREVGAGETAMGRVGLAKPAPAGGTVIHLSAGNSRLADVRQEITIPAGMTGGWFPVATARFRGPSDVRVRVTATAGEASASTELLVRSYTRLAVTIQGDGAGRITSEPEGIRCPGGACTQAFGDGAPVRLLPQPAPGSAFGGWSGDCAPDGGVVVSRPVSCTARFTKNPPNRD